MSAITQDETRLKYSVIPENVYYTRDANNPSIQILTIGVSNTGDEKINIEGFQVSVPVSTDVKKTDALTADASSIIPVSLQSAQWDFQSVGDGIFRATPIPPVTGVDAGQSITFQLKNIIVNQAAGTAVVVITENDGGGVFTTDSKQVIKIKSDLDINSFVANPTDITSGDPSILSWTTTAAARVTLTPGDFPDIKVNDSVTVRPKLTTTYTLTAFGEGPNISKQVTVQIPPPHIVDFKADPTKVDAGDMVTLSWEVQNANTVNITPGDYNNLPLKSSMPVQVSKDTTFILTASNFGQQSATSPVSVAINPVKIKSFTANPNYGLQLGNAVQLSWEIESATSAYILPGGITIQPEKLKSGSWFVVPGGATQYTLIAQNGGSQQVGVVNVLPMASGWHQYTSSAPFDTATIGVLNFRDLMWVFTQSGRTYNSWDGESWIASPAQGWGQRTQCAVCVFNGMMWLVGGKSVQGSCLNDVWSSADGASWTKVTNAAQWTARTGLACYTLPGSNKMFIAGGLDSSGNFLNDVWSTTDGVNWNQESPNAFSGGGRYGMATTVSEGMVYALGGATKSGNSGDTYNTTDGINWGKLSTPAWSPRAYAQAGTVKPGIYFGFGTNGSSSLYDINDISGSGCWIGTVSQPVSNLSPYLLEYQDALWYLGGMQGTSPSQAVWSYNPPPVTSTPTYLSAFFDFDMGSQSSIVQFMIQCTNIPVNTKVGFYADKPGTDPSICLINMTVTSSSSYMVGIQVTVPANYTCAITAYASAPQGVSFPANASIQLIAAIPANDNAQLDGKTVPFIVLGSMSFIIE